jgi:hypothetical protein
MCECGCSGNADHYVLPGPNRSVYLITLQSACINCDGPDGITIELFPSKRAVREYLCWADDEFPETVPLDKWPCSKGACISTGRTKGEFIETMKKQFVGFQPKGLLDEGQDAFDENAAEVIVEEMYEDSTMRPKLVRAKEIAR